MCALSKIWQTNNSLDEHIKLMRRQIQISLDDPATRMLATAIISGNFDNVIDPRTGEGVPAVPYHGRWYRGAPSWEDARTLCGMRDEGCSLNAIRNFLIMSVRYSSDAADEDTYQTLRATLEAGGGDCDDMTIAFAAMLKSIGFENIIARVVSLSGDQWEHVYAVAQIPRSRGHGGQWISLDITEPNRPFGFEFSPVAAKRDFAL